MPSDLVNYLFQGVFFPFPDSEEKTVLEVRLDNRWLGKISSVPSPLQLFVELDVELPDGTLQRAKALIDTGAEVDLVRSGFVPRHFFAPALVPMVFIMANGSSKLGGGSQTVELCFMFSQESVGSSQAEPFVTRHTFYEADNHVDLILGHPWMAQECVGVFPHLGCLARVGPPLIFLHPVVRKGRKRLTRGEKKSLRQNLCVTDLVPDMLGWDLQLPQGGEYLTTRLLKPREILEVQRSFVGDPPQLVSLITVPSPGEEIVSSEVLSKVGELLNKILEDYNETAFRKEL